MLLTSLCVCNLHVSVKFVSVKIQTDLLLEKLFSCFLFSQLRIIFS